MPTLWTARRGLSTARPSKSKTSRLRPRRRACRHHLYADRNLQALWRRSTRLARRCPQPAAELPRKPHRRSSALELAQVQPSRKSRLTPQPPEPACLTGCIPESGRYQRIWCEDCRHELVIHACDIIEKFLVPPGTPYWTLTQHLVCGACGSKKTGMMVASYDRQRDQPESLRKKAPASWARGFVVRMDRPMGPERSRGATRGGRRRSEC